MSSFANLELIPYQSPVHPKNFSRLAFNLMFVGFILMSWFLMYELMLNCLYSYLINTVKEKRSIVKELVVSFFGSIFIGFGLIFLIMWFGIYL